MQGDLYEARHCWVSRHLQPCSCLTRRPARHSRTAARADAPCWRVDCVPRAPPMAQAYVTAFVQALARFGWAEGKNIRLDYRFAAGNPTLFKTSAAELVGLTPDALLAS